MMEMRGVASEGLVWLCWMEFCDEGMRAGDSELFKGAFCRSLF